MLPGLLHEAGCGPLLEPRVLAVTVSVRWIGHLRPPGDQESRAVIASRYAGSRAATHRASPGGTGRTGRGRLLPGLPGWLWPSRRRGCRGGPDRHLQPEVTGRVDHHRREAAD